jgi:aminoglycoside 3-N-acetyltransferase
VAHVLLTKERLKEGLLQIGLEPGDHVMMHSSLKSFGFVAGGGDTVLDAVLETVGDEGTLLVPTNTFTGSVTVYLRGLQEIDLRTAPSQMGKITETARTRPDFIRSIHPTHPVAGSGKLAQELLSEHHLDDTATGRLSPYGKLALLTKGRVLLVGVDCSCNTMIHTAEQYYTPYIFNGESFVVKVTSADNSVHDVAVRGYCVGMERNFPVIEPFLTGAGVMNQINIGKSTVSLIRTQGLMEVLRHKLAENPFMLLHVEPF